MPTEALAQPISPEDCARALLEAVPPVMRVIRNEMRRQSKPELSVPQFRVLSYLNRQPGASLSAVADHIGLTRPAMSILVDGLVNRNLVARDTDPGDRRRLTLSLTRQGQSLYTAARGRTQARLAARLAALSPAERQALVATLEQLRGLFVPDGAEVAAPGGKG
jgi:DNA-binding MarR family transcriptional regulator